MPDPSNPRGIGPRKPPSAIVTRRGIGPVKPRQGVRARTISKADRAGSTAVRQGPIYQMNPYQDHYSIVVKGKCLYNFNNPLDMMAINNYRQQEWHPVESATYRQAFRDGGKDAGIILSIAMAPIALMELAATIFDAEVLVLVRSTALNSPIVKKEMGKAVLKAMAAKGSINLLGQFIGMTVSNEVKFDGVGMLADMVATNGASSIIGGFGEAGFKINEKGQFVGYSETYNKEVGTAKLVAGYTFGKYSETIKNGLPVGPNAVSSAMVGVFDAFQKALNEMFEQMAEQLKKADEARASKTRTDYERLKRSQEKY